MTSPAPASVRLAVAATAFTVLAYEISLTRIFSVLFRSPYVFLILSIAICGLGLGSCLAALSRRGGLAGPALALAVLLPLPISLLLTVGKSLVANANGGAVALFTLLPYVAAGMLLARAFRDYADEAGRLYFYDLAGAALAALGTATVLSALGGLAMPFLLGALAAAAAAAVARGAGRAGGAVLAVLLVALCAAQARERLLGLPPITTSDEARVKPLFQELADPAAQGRILYTKWSPVARTDVERNGNEPTLYIWTDGDVPTQMEPFSGDLHSVPQYTGMVGFVPYALQPRPNRVLCIGPGGGLDVLLGLLGGARAIEPVELNPAIVDITERFKGFYGDLYHRPEIQPGLIIDEGRSYLSRARHRYDTIYFALAKSATTQQGGMALVDNYLYTREAFTAYFDHLAPGGLLALVMQQPALVDRCLVTAVDAMLRRGWRGPELARRVAWLEVPEAQHPGPYRQLLLIRREPFDAALTARLRRVGQALNLIPRLIPNRPAPEPYNLLAQPGITAAAYGEAVAQQDQYLDRPYPGGPWMRLNLSVVTDDRPFYADLSRGLHPFLKPLLTWSLIAGLLALAAGAWAARRRRLEARACTSMAGYFGALGIGFLLVEVALVQKLVLLLGYPTLALSVILFSLLIGAALGGRAANGGSAAEAGRRLPAVIGVLVLLLLAAAALARPLTDALLPSPLPLRVLATVLVTLPLGFLMGQPYPTGLRLLGALRADLVPMAWAVNGVLSVTGSVLAVSIASRIGYQAVLMSGAGVYLLALLTSRGWFGAGLGRSMQESPQAADSETEDR